MGEAQRREAKVFGKRKDAIQHFEVVVGGVGEAPAADFRGTHFKLRFYKHHGPSFCGEQVRDFWEDVREGDERDVAYDGIDWGIVEVCEL